MRIHAARDDFKRKTRVNHDSALTSGTFTRATSKMPCERGYMWRVPVWTRTRRGCGWRGTALLCTFLLLLAPPLGLPAPVEAELSSNTAETQLDPAGATEQTQGVECTPCPDLCICATVTLIDARSGDFCAVKCSNLQQIPQTSQLPSAKSIVQM